MADTPAGIELGAGVRSNVRSRLRISATVHLAARTSEWMHATRRRSHAPFMPAQRPRLVKPHEVTRPARVQLVVSLRVAGCVRLGLLLLARCDPLRPHHVLLGLPNRLAKPCVAEKPRNCHRDALHHLIGHDLRRVRSPPVRARSRRPAAERTVPTSERGMAAARLARPAWLGRRKRARSQAHFLSTTSQRALLSQERRRNACW